MSQDLVFVIDKPSGMTSHDVVSRMRRLLRRRDVGHAGTLDPLATGVLVVLVGQATKLSPYLTADEKVYSTTIRLGVTTDSLDADGKVTREAAVPDELMRALADGTASSDPRVLAALSSELSRTQQVPPSVSAIHVDGRRAHAIARAEGADAVSLPPRHVGARALTLKGCAAAPPSLDVELHVDKGYYVRAFARDFAGALGTVGHVSRLRRLASGRFTLADATPLDPHALRPIALVEAARRALKLATLTADGITLARHGKALSDDAFEAPPPEDVPAAWLTKDGALVAIGKKDAGISRVLRGFTDDAGPSRPES